MSRTISWTDADSLTLEQICKDFGISETELDPITPQAPALFQADKLRTRATTQRRRRPKEERQSEGEEEGDSHTDHRKNKRAKVAKWAVSKASAGRVDGKKSKRKHKSDNVLNGVWRDVDKRTQREF